MGLMLARQSSKLQLIELVKIEQKSESCFCLPLSEIKDSLFKKLLRISSGISVTVITVNCIRAMRGQSLVTSQFIDIQDFMLFRGLKKRPLYVQHTRACMTAAKKKEKRNVVSMWECSCD